MIKTSGKDFKASPRSLFHTSGELTAIFHLITVNVPIYLSFTASSVKNHILSRPEIKFFLSSSTEITFTR